MTLVCRPRGRGNWRALLLPWPDDARTSPLLIRVGDVFTLGGIVWRVCEVRA